MKATQKQIKQLKKEIEKSSAINIGYYSIIINALPSYAIITAQREISLLNLINPSLKDQDIENILITEAIKKNIFPRF